MFVAYTPTPCFAIQEILAFLGEILLVYRQNLNFRQNIKQDFGFENSRRNDFQYQGDFLT